MSTTTTTTRDRGVRYGPMEWAQLAIMRQRTSVTDEQTIRGYNNPKTGHE